MNPLRMRKRPLRMRKGFLQKILMKPLRMRKGPIRMPKGFEWNKQKQTFKWQAS